MPTQMGSNFKCLCLFLSFSQKNTLVVMVNKGKSVEIIGGELTEKVHKLNKICMNCKLKVIVEIYQ